METKIDVTKDSVIGNVIKAVLGTEKVIEKYFGTGLPLSRYHFAAINNVKNLDKIL